MLTLYRLPHLQRISFVPVICSLLAQCAGNFDFAYVVALEVKKLLDGLSRAACEPCHIGYTQQLFVWKKLVQPL
jgi:hypothetical protein